MHDVRNTDNTGGEAMQEMFQRAQRRSTPTTAPLHVRREGELPKPVGFVPVVLEEAGRSPVARPVTTRY